MKLPNAHLAVVSKEKITKYLLDPTHPRGGPKAAFFIGFGFAASDFETLAEALRRHAIGNEVCETEVTEFGTRYAIDGPLAAPDGTSLNVRSAWYIDGNSDRPRFVTAHPLPRK